MSSFIVKNNSQAVLEELEEQDELNGQVSGAKVKELLDYFQKQILTGVDDRLKSIKDSGLLPTGDQTNNEIFMDPVWSSLQMLVCWR